MKISILDKIIKNINKELDLFRLDILKKEQQIELFQHSLNESLALVEREKKIANESQNTAGFPEFFMLQKNSQNALEQNILKAKEELNTLREKMLEVIFEQKRYEQIMKNLKAEERTLEAKEEGKVLDNFKACNRNNQPPYYLPNT